MSSTAFDQHSPSSAVTRRPPTSHESNVYGSQRSVKRRSLSDKLRNLFRKDSASPNRTTSNDQQPPTTARHSSPSPESHRSLSETTGLRAPTVYWPFGKKKAKLNETASSPKASKTKNKEKKNQKKTGSQPMEISSPIYHPDNSTSIYGQNFVPRTPQVIHGNYEPYPSSAYYENTPTRGFRDYTIIDETQRPQQVIVPDANVYIPSTYTTERSPSPAMNRQRLQNTNIEYQYPMHSSMPSGLAPYTDVEVIHTPQRKRKIDDAPSIANTQVVVDKPPISPQTRTRPSSNTNTIQWRNTPGTPLNKTKTSSTISLPKEDEVPKLHTPLVSLGSKSSKKKTKRTKSQSRPDDMTLSTSTISNLVKSNPVQPNRQWASTYGSLSDVEVISTNSYASPKPTAANRNKYPGLSAIVWHHIHLPSKDYREPPPTITPTPQRTRRFDTSTTTLNEYGVNESWTRPAAKDTSTSTVSRHDGYIRPMTPQKTTVAVDVNIHVDPDDLRSAPSPYTGHRSRYDSAEIPATYRSSTTIYTRDRNNFAGPGEIRTWSPRDNELSYNDCRQPYAHIEIYRTGEPTTDRDFQLVPSQTKDIYEEHRYSPRAHEQDLYAKQKPTTNVNDQEVEEEERYEISYVYEGEQPKYSYETRDTYIDPLLTDQYATINKNDAVNNLLTSNPILNSNTASYSERDYTYDQSPRSHTSNEYRQETYITGTPVVNAEGTLYTCTLKRTDSYDGIGILISTDTQTRSSHFIREVEPGSPGYRAGLRKNDRIIGINGINVENIDFNDVLILIKEGLNNDNLQMSVIHEPEHN